MTMSDDQCPATTQTGFGVVRCQMPPGHPEHHTNQSYRWYGGYPESTTPPPVPACGALTWVSDEFGAVPCSLGQGHTSDHTENTTGRELRWPLVEPVPVPETVTNEPTRHYASNDLAGVSRDDLIHNLFKRVEQLEQSSADGAATDEMFLTTNRTMDHLASGLGEIERRMAALERLVSRQGGSDLSALQSSLMNHTNRAMTDLAHGFQERHQETGARLKAMWDVLAAMAPIIDSLKPPRVTTVHQAERASGSPVRCPTQFREGQCLGWAGHDGECSAVNSSGDQLEDPEEFAPRVESNGPWDPDAEEGWKHST